MVPALEGFVVGVAVVPFHSRLKPPPRDRFEDLPENATQVAHARFPFLSFDNQKVPASRRRDRACACVTVNLPRSFFNVFCEDPPLCMFAANPGPDGLRQGHDWSTSGAPGEFVVNPDR